MLYGMTLSITAPKSLICKMAKMAVYKTYNRNNQPFKVPCHSHGRVDCTVLKIPR